MKLIKSIKDPVITVLLILFLTTDISGQVKKETFEGPPLVTAKDARLFKDRILLVGLPGIEIIDSRIMDFVGDLWIYNKQIIYLPKDQIADSIRNKEVKYAILQIDPGDQYHSWPYFDPSIPFIRFSIKLGEKYRAKRTMFYHDIIPEKHNSAIIISNCEIFFALDFIQNHLFQKFDGIYKYYFEQEVSENPGILKTKTLLLDELVIDTTLTKEEIESVYPFQYEITSLSRIEQFQRERDGRYAYVIRAGTTHYVVDCANGKMISYWLRGKNNKYYNNLKKNVLHFAWINIDNITQYAVNSDVKKKK